VRFQNREHRALRAQRRGQNPPHQHLPGSASEISSPRVLKQSLTGKGIKRPPKRSLIEEGSGYVLANPIAILSGAGNRAGESRSECPGVPGCSDPGKLRSRKFFPLLGRGRLVRLELRSPDFVPTAEIAVGAFQSNGEYCRHLDSETRHNGIALHCVPACPNSECCSPVGQVFTESRANSSGVSQTCRPP
jgi:hypothetical protein